MSTVTYAVVFSGNVVDGFELAAVKAQVAKLLKLDEAKSASLFSGKSVVIKRTPDKDEALRYGGVLKKAGADVSIRVIKPAAEDAVAAPAAAAPAAAAPAAATDTPAPAAVATADFSLAPNVGNLFEPPSHAPAVEVDISAIALAENDDTPLAPPSQVDAVTVDLSALSVAENDGAPLVAPSPETPKLAAPDLSLDAAGAVLETLKDEREPVNPDISGMSLTFPGGDLLAPEERDPGPPPVRPDISKLSLTPDR